MVASLLYIIALAVSTLLLFLVCLVPSLAIVTTGFAWVYGKKPDSDDDSYPSYFGYFDEDLARRIRNEWLIAVLLALLPPLPATLYLFRQTGYSAPWLAPASSEAEREANRLAEVEFRRSTEEFQKLTLESKQELERAQRELALTQAALDNLRRITDEQRQALTRSGSTSWYSEAVAFFLGVFQSITAAIIGHYYLRTRRRHSKVPANSRDRNATGGSANEPDDRKKGHGPEVQ